MNAMQSAIKPFFPVHVEAPVLRVMVTLLVLDE